MTAMAYDFVADGLCYSINADGESVVVTYEQQASPRYTSLAGEVVIPRTVSDGETTYVVNGIGDAAFRDCTDITSVVVGDAVATIGSNAFYCCISLTTVSVPRSITRINYAAFYGCSALTRFYTGVPDPSLWSIRSMVFLNVSSQMQLLVPPGTMDVWVEARWNRSYNLAEWLYGDVNGDGEVNVTDYTLLISHILSRELPTPMSYLAADVNGDGDINVTDASRIVTLILSN